MRDLELPNSISALVDHLQIVRLSWQGMALQVPKFAVYSVISAPVFDRYMFRNGRKMGVVRLGRYQIPVLDPLRGHIDTPPQNLVVISHIKANRFGLYGFPADTVDEHFHLPKHHESVKRLVKDFL